MRFPRQLLIISAVLLASAWAPASVSGVLQARTELTGAEARAVRVALTARNIPPEEADDYAVIVRTLDTGDVEVSILPRVEAPPGMKMNGDPTGRAITMVINARGEIVRWNYSV